MPARPCTGTRVNRCQGDSRVIKVEDWMALLSHAEIPKKDALTMGQWKDRLSKSKDATRAWLKTGLDNGWIEKAMTVVDELTGKRRRVVGFRLVKG